LSAGPGILALVISVLGGSIPFGGSNYAGEEMAGYGERGQPAGEPAGTGSEREAEESARRAWAKPVVRRFSMRETLAGSGILSDLAHDGSATPTPPPP
jgi:hypothetical protein